VPKILLGILTLLIGQNKVRLDFICIARRLMWSYLPSSLFLDRLFSQIRMKEFEKSSEREQAEQNEP
jgi:hypothetical protein